MHRLESRVKQLEAKMDISEKKVDFCGFGYATPSEIRELMAAIAENAGKFEVKP